MKAEEFKELLKFSLLEMIEEDPEVRNMVFECVKDKLKLLGESRSFDSETINEYKAEPGNTELYDKIVLVACGKQKMFKYNGKIIKTPNHGIGLKNENSIREWAHKAYGKMGGEWLSDSYNSSYGNNDSLLKEIIRDPSVSKIKNIDGHGEFDISEMLLDTAKTTLMEQKNADAGVLRQTPDEIFGTQMTNKWAKLAFND